VAAGGQCCNAPGGTHADWYQQDKSKYGARMLIG
jgi:hypothetical protein